jgi:hypothetical protein
LLISNQEMTTLFVEINYDDDDIKVSDDYIQDGNTGSVIDQEQLMVRSHSCASVVLTICGSTSGLPHHLARPEFISKVRSITLRLYSSGFNNDEPAALFWLCRVAPFVDSVYFDEEFYPHLWALFFQAYSQRFFPKMELMEVGIYSELQSTFAHNIVTQALATLAAKGGNNVFFENMDGLVEPGANRLTTLSTDTYDAENNTLDGDENFDAMDTFQEEWPACVEEGFMFGHNSVPTAIVEEWLGIDTQNFQKYLFDAGHCDTTPPFHSAPGVSNHTLAICSVFECSDMTKLVTAYLM